MPIQVNSPGWKVRRVAGSRGVAAATAVDLAGLPPEFLTSESTVTDEAVLEPALATRGLAPAGGDVDISYDLEPGQTAILAVRQPSGALTFHLPVEATSRGVGGPSEVRFQVTVRQTATRGLVGQAIKAIVVKVAKVAADGAVSLLLPRLAAAAETAMWKRKHLSEGWLKVSKATLAAGALAPGTPVSSERSLLFIHGTFSNAASAYRSLANSDFFDRVKNTYGDRMFAFDHFSLSRTPEQNVRMLLEGLPEQATTFDVITHSRGGLVLRNLVERGKQFGDLSRRFKLGRAILVASPNDGTPLATPKRWHDTVGWMANLLELFPDNPFTMGADFVANGLVWIANHASGDLPGLNSMDGDGELIEAIQSSPAPPADAYSALVANYQPTGAVLQRLLDIGIDQFFGSANDLVVPSEGGWHIGRSSTVSIPAARIGCFGPGGNVQNDSVTHVDFFSHAETVDFLVNGLLGRKQALNSIDLRQSLPDRRLLRGALPAVTVSRPAAAPVAPAAAPVAAPLAAHGAAAHPAVADNALRISVTNGDLTFEPEALMLGHYRAARLTGTEKVMDALVGGAMKRSLEMGVYPVAIGSHQVFLNTRPNYERGFMPRPKAVIVVGLGDEGKLASTDLIHSVRQAVIAWAQRLVESRRPAAGFELAATLLGSGGTGVGAGEAARLVAQGVYEANQLLQGAHDGKDRWPQVQRLHFIELYLDRATEAWRALRLQAKASPDRYLVDSTVECGTGPLQRPPDSGYRGAEFDFISVETKEEKGGSPSISYTLDTRRARSEVRGQRAQSLLLSDLVATASNDQNHDQRIGRTLFSLLVPVELEPYLSGSGEMQIELDPQTAKIPWELLDTGSGSGADAPWAIRVKLLRKLRIKEFRDRVTDAEVDDRVLVIGEPECPKEYPRLYGARLESLAVCDCLTTRGLLAKEMVRSLISDDPTQVGADAPTVVSALFERPWRIVHIAGHGQLGGDGKPGGVVLSNGTFLGPDEIGNMRTVPELVFVNCCHLGSADAGQLLNTRYDRAEFASGVAGALISIGVRCVVAAGWAVDDEAATVFAEKFYDSLMQGNRFIVAVGEARAAAYNANPNVNTWAAYQCYGDPDWVFRKQAPDANQGAASVVDDYSDVASSISLKLALERIVVQTRFQGADPAAQVESLARLETLFGQTWAKSGAVAELFGEAFVEAGDLEQGIRWYACAVAAPDGKASVKAAEQLANARSRLGWEIVDTAERRLEEMKTREKADGLTVKGRSLARHARVEAERSFRDAVVRAGGLIEQSLELLNKLMSLGQTMERANLIGSAYKRKALVDGAAGKRSVVDRDLQQMHAACQRAQEIAEESGAGDVYYPASNRLASDVSLNAGRSRWRGLDRKTAEIVSRSLKQKNASSADFWSAAGRIELDQYEALAKKRLAAVRKPLDKAYRDLHQRVKSPRMWGSVYDTACLVLLNYASRATSRERAAANQLLTQLRSLAHPGANS